MSRARQRQTPAEMIAAQARHREQERAASASVRAGIQETTQLAEGRGTAFLRPPVKQGERDKPIKRRTGLDWLYTRKASPLSAEMKAVGERYGRYWRAANGDISIRSASDDSPRGGGGDPILAALHGAEQRVYAAERMNQMRSVLGNQAYLIDALDLVCGQELTTREASKDGHGAVRLECLLTVALDLLVGSQSSHRAAHAA